MKPNCFIHTWLVIFINRSADIKNPALTRSKTMHIWESLRRKKHAFQREKGRGRKVNIWKYFSWNPRNFLRTHDFLFGTHDFFLGTHDFSLGTHDFFLGTHDFSLGTHDFSLGTHDFLFGTHDFLPTTHDFLPTTHDFLPTTHDFLPTTHDFLPTTHDILPTTHDPRLLASPNYTPRGLYCNIVTKFTIGDISEIIRSLLSLLNKSFGSSIS